MCCSNVNSALRASSLAGSRVLCTAALLVAAVVTVAAQSPDLETLKSEAAAARAQRNPVRATELYTQVVQADPQWPDGWWFLGTLLYGSDKFPEARAALTHYIALSPKAGPALALRGLCEFELAQYPEALDDLERGIALGAANQPRNAQIVLYHEALTLTLLGRYEESIGKYAVFTKQSQVTPELTTAVGLAALRIAALPRDADPAQAEVIALTGQAVIDLMQGDQPGSQVAFQQVFERYPQTRNVHYIYGYLLFPLDQDQAIVQFQKELLVSPTSSVAHAMLAWAYGLQGNFPAALPNAELAAKEDPALPMAQLVYGRSLVETGNVTGGLTHLESVIQAEPNNLEAHLTLAKAYSKLGRDDEARRERQICLAMSDQAAPNPAGAANAKR